MMSDNSKLTVIVPCYNVAAYLRDCLNSIRNQSYANLSVILIDDGSTDEQDEFVMNMQLPTIVSKLSIRKIKALPLLDKQA